MARPNRESDQRRLRAIWRARLSPDQVGLLAASCLALAMAVIGLWRGISVLALLYRMTLAFAIAWLAIFTVLSIVYRIVDTELAPPEASEPEEEEPSDTSEETGDGMI